MFARHLLLDFHGQSSSPLRLRGQEPVAAWQVRDGIVESCGALPTFAGSPVAQLRAALEWGQQNLGPEGAAVGFFGYEFARYLEPRALPHLPPHDLGLPEARLVFCRRLVPEITTPPAQVDTPALVRPLPLTGGGDFYRNGVGTIRDYIAAGDIYQANLTHRFSAPLTCSPAELYERLRAFHPMPYAALLEWDDCAIVSNSPELFLQVKEGVVRSAPIKGTIRRGTTAEEDRVLKKALYESPKDRAENVMIVDLLRNDLGRVCTMGSVRVPELFAVQTFGSLHHLVSTVEGQLRPDCDALDAFCAAFPCGSITGAPKIRAMQILSTLEPVQRGVSMGALGYFGFDGAMEWNVAIRTATCVQDRAYWHAGGGIVWDSEAAEEDAEMRLKASAIWRALRTGSGAGTPESGGRG